MDVLARISQLLQDGKHEQVAEFTRQAIDQRIPPKEILDDGLIAGMNVIGERFKKHEIFLPQVLLAARAMYAGMDLLKPLFFEEGIPNLGRIVIGTVHGDLHDIGKNLVAIMLRGAGFEVIDLGKDIPAEKFVETAGSERAAVIGMSALLTTTMPVMNKVIDLLGEKKLDGKVKVMVGGASVSEEFARRIGADAYAFDACKAVEVTKRLTGIT